MSLNDNQCKICEYKKEFEAKCIAMIGALQELSIDPKLAKVPLYVVHSGKEYVVESYIVKNIFKAISRHAEEMYPWALRTIEKANFTEELIDKIKVL